MSHTNSSRVDVLPSRPGADEIEPADYLWALWRRKLLILVCTVVCGAVAYGVAAASDPIYQATAIVGATSSVPGDLPYATVVQLRNLFQNPAVIERALATHGRIPAGLTPGTFISRNLTVERNRDTNLFVVTVRLPTPDGAAGVANLLSAEAVASYARLKAAESATAVAPMPAHVQEQIERARRRLEHTTDALTKLRTDSDYDGRVEDRDAASALRQQLSFIGAELEGARASVTALASELARENPFIDTATGRVPNQVHAGIATRAAEARSRLAGLERQQQALTRAYETAAQNAAQLPRVEVQITQLETAVRYLAQQYTAAQEAAPLMAPVQVDIAVTERATPPAAPISPRPARSLLLGLSLGLFLSVMGALLVDATAASSARVPARASATS